MGQAGGMQSAIGIDHRINNPGRLIVLNADVGARPNDLVEGLGAPDLGEGARLQVMVLRGVSLAQDGSEVQNRITWTPNPDGSVRQLWEASQDGGATWSMLFDGLYQAAGDDG